MSEKEATAPREVVIIRRKGGDEDEGKKGGAWKIAFADFMTAMMAFFLVMWLINSSDKKTITQVATYFNPLRLTDKTTSDRGVHEMTEDPLEKADKNDNKGPKPKDAPEKAKSDAKAAQKAAQSDASGGRATPDSNDKAKRFSDEELFSDPYGVLAKLALQALNPDPKLGPGALKAQDMKEGRGDAWRDPFDPATWRSTRKPRDSDFEAPPAGPPPTPDAAKKNDPSPPAATAAPAVALPPAATPQQPAAPNEQQMAQAAEAAKSLAQEINAALRAAPGLPRPELSVEATPEGLLVSLTDKSDFGMFAVGSAEPRPELVVLMESVAKVLASKTGNLVVRGHTDGRPFRGGNSDNWRLSTSRAHMTHYMLVRGGVPERRIERIEGYADQKLRVTNDPEAARNRRIEILLRVNG